MAYINPKYPAIQVTQAEYDAITYHDPHTLYCIPSQSQSSGGIVTGKATVDATGIITDTPIIGTAQEVL